MLKETIKYEDLDGNPAEMDAYFNLTKAEAIELNIRNDLEVIGRSKNNNEIMDTFKRILKAAYGKRTGNGDFIKEERDWLAFAPSEAYSELFMKLWQDPEYGAEFIKKILPKGIIDEAPQESQSNIPTHLANHPSMQGHQARRAPETRREAREPVPTSVPNGMNDADRAELEAFRRAQGTAVVVDPYAATIQTPPDRVSSPEAPLIGIEPERDNLI